MSELYHIDFTCLCFKFWHCLYVPMATSWVCSRPWFKALSKLSGSFSSFKQGPPPHFHFSSTLLKLRIWFWMCLPNASIKGCPREHSTHGPLVKPLGCGDTQCITISHTRTMTLRRLHLPDYSST